MGDDAVQDVAEPSPSGQASKEKDSTGLVGTGTSSVLPVEHN